MTTRMEQAERLTTSISATQPLASPGRQVRLVDDVLITITNIPQREKQSTDKRQKTHRLHRNEQQTN